jgi:hypothetical protein
MTIIFNRTFAFITIVSHILFVMPVKGQESKNIQKWNRVDYPYIDNTFFQKLPISHSQQYAGDMGITDSFIINSFENYITIQKLWISKNKKKYKAQIKYVTSESLDTLDIKNYIFYDSVNYDPLYPEPKGKRIIRKIVNDSLFIFPYYWESKFDSHNSTADSLYKIKPPYGIYQCGDPSCFYCKVNYADGTKMPPTKKDFMFLVNPDETFTITDFFDNTPGTGFYYQIDNIRWKPLQYTRVKNLNYVIGKIYFQAIGPNNYYYRQDTLGIGLAGEFQKKASLTQAYYYQGTAEPQFNKYKKVKGVTIAFSDNQLYKNKVYKLEITIDPQLLKFNDENKAIIPIKLFFSEGLVYETTLVVFK